MSQPSAQQISAHLQETKSLHPNPTWLASFLASQRPNTPLPALVQTAKFRLLASDITSTLVAGGDAGGNGDGGEGRQGQKQGERAMEGEGGKGSACFPADVGDVGVGERRLGGGGGGGGVMTQVLAVEDLSKSRWEQIEAMEALERGEGTKGREIIRVTTATATAGGGGGDELMEEETVAAVGGGTGVQRGVGGAGGPHKLLLQDASGRKVWAMELRRVDGVGVGMCIGCKILLKGTRIARGWILLEPETASVVGGKIEDLQRKWREGRKAELKAQLDVAADGRTV